MVEESKQGTAGSQHILSTKENTEAWLTEKAIPFHVSGFLKRNDNSDNLIFCFRL